MGCNAHRTGVHPERIDAIRRCVETPSIRGPIHYIAPWTGASLLPPGTLDFIWSQAVMEHIEDTRAAYRAMHAWLRPGGFMSHSVDYDSHGHASGWNGHWTVPSLAWRIVRGNRPFFINRQPHSSHRSEIQAAGFEIVCEERIESPPLPRHRLAARNSGASPTPISRPPARLHPSLETITCTKRHLASGGSPPPQNHPRNLPDARAFPLEDIRSGRTGGNRPLRSGDQGRAAFVRKLPDHLPRPLG